MKLDNFTTVAVERPVLRQIRKKYPSKSVNQILKQILGR